MKKGSTLFLRLVICLIAIGVLAGMIWFPQTEGRATNLDLISIYTDPFIIYIYIASISFFVGLYQAFKLLHFIDANKAFSQDAVHTIKTMKFASLSLIGFIALAVFYIRFFVHGDDSAGPTMLGICMAFAFGVIATAAGVFQKLFQNAVDIKSENDLTV
ncbi:membrane protein [Ktedonobacter sp. SOSP1-85]|uniref:DUF2975 domain-containing protein n=1 Tax=Ktedonobacter sp. SOSP1-85 TaxID=2778367 RepID=UPI001915269A|nr:DUF2975 domain-containing protein [Ktedonobacter sp. SOSP1-85]GHO81687.1 membrane protein [Ktedonobacter sp. SOSP1-85]